ncbi:MAG: glucose-1-phosphate adenylyltransferase [Chloroflexi bacterium]|nr:glucose-1-phosphate adenylyltransferase [Chloroflexota bacterium]
MNRVLAMILAGGRGDRLSILSEKRAKPAVIFGGKYRIIDFTLSNCVNSGINRVAILTQYRPRSLNDHIGIGKPWDLDRTRGGVFLLQPFLGRNTSDWYRNTADAAYQNLSFVEDSNVQQVLILSGDHVYRMLYDELIAYHRHKGADLTLCTTTVPVEDARRFGIVTADSDGKIVEFLEKPRKPASNVISMGVYVFNPEILIERLQEDARDPKSTHDFGKDVIPSMVGRDKVFAFPFNDFWVDVGTVESYWQANMELIADLPRLNLYDSINPLLTKPQNRAPAKISPRAEVMRSLVCDGCIVNGLVRNSILSPGVVVDYGAVVEDSILFDDCYVGDSARIHRAILDKEVKVGAEACVGWGDDYTPNREEPGFLFTGITVVGKGARIPQGTRIGRNCKVYPDTEENHFLSDTIESGETVKGLD